MKGVILADGLGNMLNAAAKITNKHLGAGRFERHLLVSNIVVIPGINNI